MNVSERGLAFPLLSFTVTVVLRGSVYSLAAIRNSSFPLVSAFVWMNVTQFCAEEGISTTMSVLYWTSTSTVPPAAGTVTISSPSSITFFSSCSKVSVIGATRPPLSVTVTLPVRGSVLPLAANRNTSFPLDTAFVPLKAIHDWAPASTSTEKFVLYWMSTVKVPPSAGILDVEPTVIIDLASWLTEMAAVNPSLRKVMVPLVSVVEFAAAAVTVTVASPSPDVGETVRPVPLTTAVQG